jgi:hypothetical protein
MKNTGLEEGSVDIVAMCMSLSWGRTGKIT